MGMLKEFKEFAMKGNLVDIAVAFVMGAAFNRVVTSFTGGLVSPLVGLLTGKDLSQNKWVIKEQIKDAAGTVTQPEVALMWGAFLTAIIDFIIVAFVMFLIIKAINTLKKKEPEAPPPPTPEDVILLREIRDALKK
ncbi:MAG TPA: large conductance mechanosensitive channel protein MscL [Chitinophagaceae bacterium]